MTAPHDVSGVHTVIGVDAGSVNLAEADHRIHRLAAVLDLPAGAFACTHLVRTAARPRTAVSFALPDADSAAAVWERLTVLLAGPDEPPAAAAWGGREYGQAEAVGCAAAAADEHAGRYGGRAVVYPGVGRLTGTVTVADLLARSAIDHVVMVGAPAGEGPDPAARVLTRGHVRPEWRAGRLGIALNPAPGGMLAPFEVPNPTPCCADHP
jgi:hypothetical protein